MDDAKPVSGVEEAAISKLLTAYARLMRSDLDHASDGPRVFVIMTAPNARVGRVQIVTDLTDEALKRFLQMSLDHHDEAEARLFRLEE